MTTKLNIWPLLKANHFSGRSLIFSLLGDWLDYQIVAKPLEINCWLKNPFALQHVAKTLNNYSAMRLWVWHPYTAFYSGKKGMITLQGLARAITCWTRALLMENKSAQSRREFKREYFVLAAAFQREPFYLSNLPSGGEFFGLQTSAGHVLCAKAIRLSGYDCMQNINWKWGSARNRQRGNLK